MSKDNILEHFLNANSPESLRAGGPQAVWKEGTRGPAGTKLPGWAWEPGAAPRAWKLVMEVRKVRILPSRFPNLLTALKKPQRNALTKTLQMFSWSEAKPHKRQTQSCIYSYHSRWYSQNREMETTLAHNDTYCRGLKNPSKLIQNQMKSIVSTWMNLFSSKDRLSTIFPPSLLTLLASSKPRFFQQTPLQWAGMKSQLYREWPDALRAGTGMFLATVYKQSWSDGLLIDFESVNTSRFLCHHLATVAWQQPWFFQEWLTRTKKGNTFAEK